MTKNRPEYQFSPRQHHLPLFQTTRVVQGVSRKLHEEVTVSNANPNTMKPEVHTGKTYHNREKCMR